MLKIRLFLEKVMLREEIDDILNRFIPYGRFGTPEDMVKVITFLLSDESSYINGKTICVTGGW